jgi:hypothetical protein
MELISEITCKRYRNFHVLWTSGSPDPNHVTVLPDVVPTGVAGGATPASQISLGLDFLASSRHLPTTDRPPPNLPTTSPPSRLHPRFDRAPSRPSLLPCCRIRSDAHCTLQNHHCRQSRQLILTARPSDDVAELGAPLPKQRNAFPVFTSTTTSPSHPSL